MGRLLWIGAPPDRDALPTGVDTEFADAQRELTAVTADCVAIGADAPDPLAIAQRVHAGSPDAVVVVVRAPGDDAQVRRELLFTPFLGRVEVAAPADAPALRAALDAAVVSGAARRSHAERLQSQGELPSGPPWALRPAELSRSLLTLAPVGVILIDAEARVVEANPAAGEALGFDPRRVHGATLRELLGKAGEAAALRGPADEPVQVVGRERHVAWRRASVANEAGEGTLLTVADVTAQVAAQRLREQVQRQAAQRQRLDSLTTLAGGVAHDFNNLLMVIQGSAELAQARLPTDAAVGRLLNAILRASTRAGELTRAMLAYAGRDARRVEPLDLVELVEERAAAEAIREVCQVRVRAHARGLLVSGDADQLGQVLQALVTNASESMQGAQPVDVVLRPAVAGDPLEPPAVVLEVSDSGCGIPAEVRGRVFDPFFSTRQSHGLGLAASQGIVRSHGGVIDFVDRPAGGTTFRVVLPLLSRETPDEAAPAVAARHSSDLVLVVDDESLVAEVTAMAIERLGLQAEIKSDGRQALEALRAASGEMALVVLDMRMPGMDGRQVFVELRRAWPDLPVLLCSGYVGDQVADLLAQGPTGFLKKPFSLDAFEAAVADVLGA